MSIMGGSVTFGNWTPAAEFNIYVDPEAAYRVFNSGLHIKMSGINLTRQCCLTAEHVAEFRKIGTKARISQQILQNSSLTQRLKVLLFQGQICMMLVQLPG